MIENSPAGGSVIAASGVVLSVSKDEAPLDCHIFAAGARTLGAIGVARSSGGDRGTAPRG